MPVVPGQPAAQTPAAVAAAPPGEPRPSLKELGLRTLLLTLPLAIASFAIFLGAVQFVLLPLQVQEIDPGNQTASLAFIIGISAIASMVAAPIAGALTDRTRTRIGGRAPWMIAGAVTTLVLATGMGSAHSVGLLAAYLVGIQLAVNFILTPASAYIPDRVPVVKRGVFSAVYGAAQMVGAVLGQSVGAAFAGWVHLGYIVSATGLAVFVVLFALVNARSNRGEPRAPVTLGSLLRTFWVDPVAHPNFAWAFAGRFMLFIGFFPMQNFLLYLLQDYIGLGGGAVERMPVLALANSAGTLVGSVLGGVVAQRLGRTRPLIYVAAGLIVLGLAFPLLAPSLASMMAYSVLAGFGMGAFIAVDLVLVTMVLPSGADAGKDLGIINVTTTLPQTIGAALGGAAVGLFGGYEALIPLAMITTALGAVLIAFIRGVR